MLTDSRPGVALVLVLAVMALLFAPPARAQDQNSATMTVLGGEVAVVRPDGSDVRPAPSGTLVYPGDEIRTLSATGALITFLVGTEIELGEDTALVVERVSRQGERIDIAVKQVNGASLNRVASFTSPGSLYRIEAGGEAVEVHGTTFSVLGPYPTARGDVVVVVCMEDCDGRSTFAGAPLAPFTGFLLPVNEGRAAGPVQQFGLDRRLGYWGNLWEGAAAFEQTGLGDVAAETSTAAGVASPGPGVAAAGSAPQPDVVEPAECAVTGDSGQAEVPASQIVVGQPMPLPVLLGHVKCAVTLHDFRFERWGEIRPASFEGYPVQPWTKEVAGPQPGQTTEGWVVDTYAYNRDGTQHVRITFRVQADGDYLHWYSAEILPT